MFFSSLIEEICSKEENNKASCTLTFGGQCLYIHTSKVSPNAVYKLERKVEDIVRSPHYIRKHGQKRNPKEI